MKNLVTLAAHNEAERKKYDLRQGFQLNGIACPKCGAELFDSDPDTTLTSDPPQKSIACTKCGYLGYRVA